MSTENSTALKRLLNAARPFKPFQIDIDGRIFDGFVRKPSMAENQAISEAWDKIYNSTMESVENGTTDIGLSTLFATLKRQKKNTLIKYILVAEEMDLVQETISLFGGEIDTQSSLFKEELNKVTKAREEDLSVKSDEELLNLAMERRAHYYAVTLANAAMTRKTAQITVFDEDKNPFFTTEDEVNELTLDALQKLTKAASECLAEETKDVNPLDSPQPRKSGRRSSSQKNLAVE